MGSEQEFRDRCARAMGWEVGHFTIRPDEDYNQAMMMRDRCHDLGLRSEFVRELIGMEALAQDWKVRFVPTVEGFFATARKFAEAALKVLEGAKEGGGE